MNLDAAIDAALAEHNFTVAANLAAQIEPPDNYLHQMLRIYREFEQFMTSRQTPTHGSSSHV